MEMKKRAWGSLYSELDQHQLVPDHHSLYPCILYRVCDAPGQLAAVTEVAVHITGGFFEIPQYTRNKQSEKEEQEVIGQYKRLLVSKE